MAFEKPGVIIDNGSYNIKAGFSCDNHPISIFSNVVGRPKYLKGKYGRQPYDVYVGNSALLNDHELDVNRPVVNGRIVHWDNMERIWHHIYYRELKTAPEDRAALLALGPTTSINEMIKSSEIFYETFNCPALSVQPQCVLSMYSAGLSTGICVDMGHDTTDVVPVFEGGLLKYALIQTGLAGAQISEYVQQHLHHRATSIDLEVIKKNTYVTHNSAMPRNKCLRKYFLLCGEEVNITNECFMSAEMLFQPDLVLGKETNYIPLHEAIVSSISRCDTEIQDDMYDNLNICGGVAMMPGVAKRLAVELKGKIDKRVEPITSTESHATAFLGASVLFSLEGSQILWVDRKQYDEQGIRIIKNKFLF